MKKSELKALISEVISEMDNPYAGVKFEKNVTTLDKTLQPVMDNAKTGLSQLHSKLKSAVEKIYGTNFSNINVYIKVGADGKSEISINGSPTDTKIEHGGYLEIKVK